ncbi:MAG: hypothetical protein ABEN55_03610 [Bradymonadaceae bacterium]
MSTTTADIDPSPWRRRLAVPAYYSVTFAPFAVIAGLLRAVEWAAGAAIPVLWTLGVLFVLRQINVFVLSTLYHRTASHAQLTFHPRLEWELRVWGWLFLDDGLEEFIGREEHRFFGVLGLRFPLLVTASAAVFSLGVGLEAGAALLAALAILPGLTGAALSSTIYIINGLAHVVGYRRFDTDDTSRNLLRKDLLAWGKTLHHNHHARPGRVDPAVGSDERDAGYAALKQLERIGWVDKKADSHHPEVDHVRTTRAFDRPESRRRRRCHRRLVDRFFADEYGDEPITLVNMPREVLGDTSRESRAKEVALREALEKMPDDSDVYLRFSPLLEQCPELLGNLPVDWLRSRRPFGAVNEMFRLFIGGGGSNTGFHAAIWSTET